MNNTGIEDVDYSAAARRVSVRVAFDSAGSGEPLVLLHGVGASRAIWRRVIDRLAGERLVLAPDIPGLGDSPPVGEGFELFETADALADAVSELAPGPFDLVGNSLGGAVAVVLARRRPDLVRRLVLAAPAGFSPRPAIAAGTLGRLSESAIASRRVLGAALAGNVTARRILLWGTVADPERMSTADARAMFDASRDSSRVGAAVAAVLESDLGPELRELDVPLGLIWGVRDGVIPITTVRSILAVRPEALVETIHDAAHVPHFERPDEFVAALRRLLERLDRVSAQ